MRARTTDFALTTAGSFRVHYISLILDNQMFPVDIWYNSQQNWQMEDIDIAFQMDGDFAQHPYSVWLDRVNLAAW